MFVTKRSLKVQWVGWCLVSLTLVSLAWLTVGCGGISLGSGRSKDQSIVYAPPEQQQSVENPEVAPTEEKPRDIETTSEPQPLEEFSLFPGVTRIYYPTNPTYQESRNPYANHVGQCTWYVFGRIQESEVGLPSFLQNYESLRRIFSNPNIQAKDWDDRIDREINNGTRLVGMRLEGLKLNIVVRSQPRPKSIAVWDYNNLSHVAFVENNGQITQSNYVLYDPKNRRYYLNPGEVVMRETVPILDDKGKEVGKAQQFHIMRVVKEETRKGKQGYILEPVPDGGNNLRGWAEWKEVVPNTIWNYTRIDRNPSPIWGDSNQIKYICLDVPDITKLSSPSDGAKNVVPTNLELRWNSVNRANYYIVQVATNDKFSSPIINQRVTTTSIKINLQTDTKYWWRVKAGNDNGESPWSSENERDSWISPPKYRSFTTLVLSPTLLEPSNGATNVPITVTLKWRDNNNDKNRKSYRVQVARNSNFTSPDIDRNITTTSVTVNLRSNTRYWWRVKTIGVNGESNWSDTWSFTTRK
jgi:surface antigen